MIASSLENETALRMALCLFNETSLMLFAFTKRYQTLLEGERMPPGGDRRADLEIIFHMTQEYTADGQGIRSELSFHFLQEGEEFREKVS